MTIYIYTANRPSEGAAALRRAMKITRLRQQTPGPGDVVINWGVSDHVPGIGKIVNPPVHVTKVVNKLTAFQTLAPHCNMPDWTTDKAVAQAWLETGDNVIVRNLLTSHSGHGIMVIRPSEIVPDAPLYTRYVPKTHEFRIHVMGGKIIDQQRKIRDNDVPDDQVNWQVRTHETGFFYVRNGFEVPADVRSQALAAVEAAQLDFGAVDVIWHNTRHVAMVLEINTAPGIEGTTITHYATALKELIGVG